MRDADFSMTFNSSSTGARQEAEVLYTAAAFGANHLNRCHEFLETHPKLKRQISEHLEETWLYEAGIFEYLLARLDVIEGLQGASQASALAQNSASSSTPTKRKRRNLYGDLPAIPTCRHQGEGQRRSLMTAKVKQNQVLMSSGFSWGSRLPPSSDFMSPRCGRVYVG
jgi:hypothetical protein